MRIGIDFDNTIACYDGVFHRAALERGLVPAELATDKTSVRDHLRATGREDDWTELQGYVYGARMDLVDCYPGVREFIGTALDQGIELAIVSHKTRTPYRGPEYDLHNAAREFLLKRGIVGSGEGVIADEHTFFELTLADKLARIAAERCDIFIDDLPELLTDPAFPAGTRPILFDPYGQHDASALTVHRSWREIADALLRQDG